MDEIQNKSDREILVEVHTTLSLLAVQVAKHVENDKADFKEINGKINKVYIGIAAIIIFLGWIAKSKAGY